MTEKYYRANVKLLIPNAPGAVPSSVRVQPGEVVILDGTEPLNVPMMIQVGAITPLDGPPPPEKVNIMPTRKGRRR
mgnify:FL=1